MKITPYHTQPLTFDYLKPSKYNLELEMQVLQHKQDTYNKTYTHLQNLKRQGLSLNFFSKAGRDRVLSLNEQISKSFSEQGGTFGDLSDVNVTSRYMDLFKGFADPKLIKLYHKEAGIRGQITELNKLRHDKDGASKGYNSVREAVYFHDLQEYSNSETLDESLEKEIPSYTPYVDVAGLVDTEYGELPSRTLKDFEIGTDGRIINSETEIKDDTLLDRVGDQISMEHLDQFRSDAKYTYIVAKEEYKDNPEGMTAFKRDVARQELDYYEPALAATDKALSELEEKEGLTQQQKDTYKMDLTTRKNYLNRQIAAYENFPTLSDNQFIDALANISKNKMLHGLKEGHRIVSSSRTVESDDAFFKRQNLYQNQKKLEAELALSAAKLAGQTLVNQLKQLELEEAEEKVTGPTGRVVSVPDPELVKEADKYISERFGEVSLVAGIKFDNDQRYRMTQSAVESQFGPVDGDNAMANYLLKSEYYYTVPTGTDRLVDVHSGGSGRPPQVSSKRVYEPEDYHKRGAFHEIRNVKKSWEKGVVYSDKNISANDIKMFLDNANPSELRKFKNWDLFKGNSYVQFLAGLKEFGVKVHGVNDVDRFYKMVTSGRDVGQNDEFPTVLNNVFNKDSGKSSKFMESVVVPMRNRQAKFKALKETPAENWSSSLRTTYQTTFRGGSKLPNLKNGTPLASLLERFENKMSSNFVSIEKPMTEDSSDILEIFGDWITEGKRNKRNLAGFFSLLKNDEVEFTMRQVGASDVIEPHSVVITANQFSKEGSGAIVAGKPVSFRFRNAKLMGITPLEYMEPQMSGSEKGTLTNGGGSYAWEYSSMIDQIGVTVDGVTYYIDRQGEGTYQRQAFNYLNYILNLQNDAR